VGTSEKLLRPRKKHADGIGQTVFESGPAVELLNRNLAKGSIFAQLEKVTAMRTSCCTQTTCDFSFSPALEASLHLML
jgi:hypothetical protein